MPISQSVLRSKAQIISSQVYKSLNERFDFSLARPKKTAFLCHSHKDENLIIGLLVLFKEIGIDLYIDWKDHSMPEVPNGDTARKIQTRIKELDIFLFLATADSKASRWCPWEIGYADSSRKGIYIIPTNDGYNSYGNEYLDLYSKIDSGTYKIDGRPGYFLTKANENSGYAVTTSALI